MVGDSAKFAYLNLSTHILKFKYVRNFKDVLRYAVGLDLVTNLVSLLKLDSNHWFFSPYALEIWWMTSKNNRAPCLGYINLCALFQSLNEVKLELQLYKQHTVGKFGKLKYWEPKASVQDNTDQTTDNGYTTEEKHNSPGQSKWLLQTCQHFISEMLNDSEIQHQKCLI